MEENNKLQLSVQKLELGTLTTNAIKIRDNVKEMLKGYTSDNYSEETIEQAKEDKAMLNNASKKLNDERIRLEKEFNKPFEEFKSVVTETITMIKEASSSIDQIVKEVENKAKETRKLIVIECFNKNIKELSEIVSLDMIFDEKWLNKGSFNNNNEFKSENELVNKLDKIRTELSSIKALNSKYETSLTNQYLKNFNLGEVIIENNRLQELEKKTVIVEKVKVEIEQKEKEEAIEKMVSEPVKVEDIDPIKTYRLEITGTLSQQQALAKFLQTNNMTVINLDKVNKEEKEK